MTLHTHLRGSAPPWPGTKRRDTLKQYRQLDERSLALGHCVRHQTPLVYHREKGKIVDAWCEQCVRLRAGLCMDCGEFRSSRKYRCEKCRRAAMEQDRARYKGRNMDEVRRRARIYQRRKRGLTGEGSPRKSAA